MSQNSDKLWWHGRIVMHPFSWGDAYVKIYGRGGEKDRPCIVVGLNETQPNEAVVIPLTTRIGYSSGVELTHLDKRMANMDEGQVSLAIVGEFNFIELPERNSPRVRGKISAQTMSTIKNKIGEAEEDS
ncbi:type II toxin-antitoxin system PemK/MazF family toxin [Azospirillum sp. TSO5]|uniref:type II toxin-antitoxin system PemK/MazF family toxin n=1 Tax=Azospirillum sp. TSO5 TaxID=716760 RepID=UPI0011B245E9|nr:type II toxin-antitoxin system PemK/MazF family toxin [Azospirillum sp. TSO5]